MATVSDKCIKRYGRATGIKTFSLFWASTINNRIKKIVYLISGLKPYVAPQSLCNPKFVAADIFLLSSYSKMTFGGNPLRLLIEMVTAFKNAKSHIFWKLTKFAKLQDFKLFSFFKSNQQWTKIYPTLNIKVILSLLYLKL